MCGFICDLAEGYHAAMKKHGKEILGDIANYTHILPVLWVSGDVGERSDGCKKRINLTRSARLVSDNFRSFYNDGTVVR